MRMLLESNSLVDPLNGDDETPLHLAARNGNPQMVALLMDHGANVHAKNNKGQTPLHLASEMLDIENIRYDVITLTSSVAMFKTPSILDLWMAP